MNEELPEMRCIRSPECDTAFTEDEIALIADAICEGQQLQYFGSEERSSYANAPLRQTCLTVYIEPHTKTRRYAVESWDGLEVWKWDFGTRPAASKYFLAECDRLGI